MLNKSCSYNGNREALKTRLAQCDPAQRSSACFEYNGKSLIPLLQAVLIMSQCQAPDKATGEQERTQTCDPYIIKRFVSKLQT